MGAAGFSSVSDPESLLNLREAARRLRMGESTLRQKLYKGQGPVGIKLAGSNQWKFRPADIDAYERAGEITPQSLPLPAPTRRTPTQKPRR
jgi:predicted DNA-binding transcriptional regulator AlpA